jgi:hypothetical protein
MKCTSGKNLLNLSETGPGVMVEGMKLITSEMKTTKMKTKMKEDNPCSVMIASFPSIMFDITALIRQM